MHEAYDSMYEVLIDGEYIDEVLEKSNYLVVFPFDPTTFDEKDIEDMTNLIKILKEKSTALEELPKKVDGIQDALNCALGGD